MEGTMGQVINFAGFFAPKDWLFCQGQLLPISQYASLYSILGTTYGGDGRSSFGLPDFRGRVAVGTGQGPGLSDYRLGYAGGYEEVTLNVNQMPTHNHSINATDLEVEVNLPLSLDAADKSTPDSGDLLATTSDTEIYAESSSNTVSTPLTGTASGSPVTLNSGAGQAHENRQPFLAMNYVICINGVYPTRS